MTSRDGVWRRAPLGAIAAAAVALAAAGVFAAAGAASGAAVRGQPGFGAAARIAVDHAAATLAHRSGTSGPATSR